MPVIGAETVSSTSSSTGGGTGGGLTESEVRTIARQEASALDTGDLKTSTNPYIALEELISRSDTIQTGIDYGNGRVSSIQYTRADGGRYTKTFDYDTNGRLINIVFTDSTGVIEGITPSYSTITKNISYNGEGLVSAISYATTTATA